jgi:hypothetical protein
MLSNPSLQADYAILISAYWNSAMDDARPSRANLTQPVTKAAEIIFRLWS